MFGGIIKAITGSIWVVLLLRNRTSPAAHPGVPRPPAPRRPPARWRSPRVPRESLQVLEDVQPPTREEIELYVPEAYRDLGPDWIFTRGKVLTFSETAKTRVVGSVGGFDVAQEFEEQYSVYRGVYGYYDHTRRIQTFTMPSTENERLVRPGRPFIICFDRRSPRAHHLFTLVRISPR
jgi:hypothetical protein